MCGPVGIITSWLSGAPALPASSRAYVSGASVTLGLRFRRDAVEIEASEHDLPRIVPAINSIIGESITEAGPNFSSKGAKQGRPPIAAVYPNLGL